MSAIEWYIWNVPSYKCNCLNANVLDEAVWARLLIRNPSGTVSVGSIK